MEHLFEARSQFAISMVFHIIFAVYGIGLPLLMVMAEWLWIRSGDGNYLTLARRWAQAGSLLFAIGAVSGTAIAFELGLLWPRFMQFAGPVIGMPFSMEGFAFFLEAIFFALYLYGWERLSQVAHIRCGVAVAASAVASGVFVMDANSWMNSPAGLEIRNGAVVGAHPWVAMLNPFASSEILHMVLAAYITVGFGVAAVYARALLRDSQDPIARRGFGLAFTLAAILAPLQILSGHHSSLAVAQLQPPKLAAMEGLFHTTACAPEMVGGIPDPAAQTVRFGMPDPVLAQPAHSCEPARRGLGSRGFSTRRTAEYGRGASRLSGDGRVRLLLPRGRALGICDVRPQTRSLQESPLLVLRSRVRIALDRRCRSWLVRHRGRSTTLDRLPSLHYRAVGDRGELDHCAESHRLQRDLPVSRVAPHLAAAEARKSA